MHLHSQRRMVIVWSVVITSMLAVVFWRFTGAPFPEPQLRILIVAFGVAAGLMNLRTGVLLCFSRSRGWSDAAVPLLWAGITLIISFDALLASSDGGHPLYLPVLAAITALAASVLARRNRERSDAS